MRRSIVRLGHPALRFGAEPVDVEALKDSAWKDLMADLEEALMQSRALALTAPQLGVEAQVLAFRSQLPGAADATSEIRIVVNPMLEPEHGELIYDWEDCLSIPDLKGLVPRYPTVRLRGIDAQARPVDLTAEGQMARTLQHAHDHLSGVVFLDRMRDLRSLAFGSEWEQFLGTDGSSNREEEARE